MVIAMADKVYSAVIAGVLGNQSVANVLNYVLTEGDGDPVALAEALIDALEAGLFDSYCDCLPVAYKMTSVKCKRVSIPGGPTVVRIMGPTDHVGTRTGEVSTTAAGPVILSQGTNGVKYLSAKIFLPGVSETDIAVNTFTAGLLTALTGFKDTLEGELPLAGSLGAANYIIYNRTLKTWIDVSNTKISLKPGIQRRRMVPIA